MHQHFVRGQPALCRYMKRLKIKGTGNKKPVKAPFKPSSATPKAKNASTRLSPLGQVASQATTVERNLLLNFPMDASSATITNSRSPLFASNTGEQSQSLSSNDVMLRSYSSTITHSRSDVDLFDEDTLASVLSTVLENPHSMESVPSDGDCVIFEGMQFFFRRVLITSGKFFLSGCAYLNRSVNDL